MASVTDTSRLSAHHDPTVLADPHPDLPSEPILSDSTPDSASAPTPSPANGGRISGGGGGMHGAMSARYDPSTKLATGTTMGEYRRINMWSTTVGMWGGIMGGGLITLALRRRTNISRNALTFAFLFSASSLSYGISQSLVQNRLSEVIAKANEAKIPRAPDGGGLMLSDNAPLDASSDAPAPVLSEDEAMKRELKNLGRERRRTRWGKGRGLDGEVEEEGEMRDTFFRPGVPRREV